MAAPDLAEHVRYMRRCLELARTALDSRDTPVGSLVVRDGRIVAEGVEAVHARRDVTAHAEIVALRAAFEALGTTDLSGCTLYTSVEPCPMCAYAIRLARVEVVVMGARSRDASHESVGYRLLADPRILPNRSVPLLVRDVLGTECLNLLMEPR